MHGMSKIIRARKNQAGALGPCASLGNGVAVKQGVAGLNLYPPGHFIHARHIRGGLRTSCMLCPVGYVRPMDLDPRRCTKCGQETQLSGSTRYVLTTRDVTVTASPQSTANYYHACFKGAAVQLPASAASTISNYVCKCSKASVTKAQPARQTQQLKAQAVAVSATTSATPIAQRKPTYTCISGKCS